LELALDDLERRNVACGSVDADHGARLVDVRNVAAAHEACAARTLHLDVEVDALAGERAIEIRTDGRIRIRPEDFADEPPGDLGERLAEPRFVVAAVEPVAALAIDVADHRRNAVGDPLQPLLAFLGLRLRGVNVGYVLDERVETDDAARRILIRDQLDQLVAFVAVPDDRAL